MLVSVSSADSFLLLLSDNFMLSLIKAQPGDVKAQCEASQQRNTEVNYV